MENDTISAAVSPPDFRTLGAGTMIFGGFVVTAGLLALIAPFVAALSVTWMISIALVAAGVSAIAASFDDHGAGRKIVDQLLAFIAIVVAIIMLIDPFAGALSLATLVMIMLVARGLVELALGFTARTHRGWLLMGGVIDLALAVILFLAGPVEAIGLVGLYVGISLVFWGIALLMGGGRLRAVAHPS